NPGHPVDVTGATTHRIGKPVRWALNHRRRAPRGTATVEGGEGAATDRRDMRPDQPPPTGYEVGRLTRAAPSSPAARGGTSNCARAAPRSLAGVPPRSAARSTLARF